MPAIRYPESGFTVISNSSVQTFRKSRYNGGFQRLLSGLHLFIFGAIRGKA